MAYSCRHSFQFFPSSPAGNCLLMLWRAARSLSIYQLNWLWRKDHKDMVTPQLRHNGHDGVLNHQPHDCLLKRLFRHRSKTTSKLRITGLCEGNSPIIGEFPAQRASNAENVSIWWRHNADKSHSTWQFVMSSCNYLIDRRLHFSTQYFKNMGK